MITFDNLCLRRGARVLFNHASLQLHAGWKIGLTGANGTGKSSLFAAFLGQLAADKGELIQPRQWVVAHMAQEVETSNTRALDFVLAGDHEWWQLNTQIMDTQLHLSDQQISQLHTRFDEIDGYTAPSRAAEMLYGLGFNQSQHELQLSDFSGGWRMRLNLARTLMSRSDLLLLDEPTNHLDLDALIWLEQWLIRYTGTLLLISHDRDFLDAIISHTLHLEHETLTLYKGNYSAFEVTRAERLAQLQKNLEKQQATRAHLESYINRFQAKASKAKQAQSRIKQLQRMAVLAPAHIDSPFNFSFYSPDSMGSPLIRLTEAHLGYDRNAPILRHVNVDITPETRLAILGFNGAGKSTLVKSLVGELKLVHGTRHTAQQLKLGYFAQHQLDSLDGQASPLLMIKRLSTKQISETKMRAFIGGFGFSAERMDTPCQIFSGGERVRLALALLVWQRPNVLILDEPTNHLDLEMRHALTLALQDFEGAVVLISHDRQLLSSVCDDFILVHQGVCGSFDGDISDYIVWMQRNKPSNTTLKPASVETKKPVAALPERDNKRKITAQHREQSKPIRQHIETLEKQLTALGHTLQSIDTQLGDAAIYGDNNKDELRGLLIKQAEQKTLFAQTEALLLEQMLTLETLEQSFIDGR